MAKPSLVRRVFDRISSARSSSKWWNERLKTRKILVSFTVVDAWLDDGGGWASSRTSFVMVVASTGCGT